MNIMKSIFAALFVGEVGYLIGLTVAIARECGGLGTNKVLGLGGWAQVATSGTAIFPGILFFVISLWFFIQY